jgi:signal transduction histidine kinase
MNASATIQTRQADLEASRARIVAAADEARKRLERDLHDGAQQRFVLASLWLKGAAVQAHGTPAEPFVAEAVEQLQHGLAELRDLAHGIHPAVLSERGRALTNVAKHAQATHATVSIEIDDGALIAQIADDGLGGASTTAGAELRGLADRLDALGGTLTVHSPRGGGTRVRAQAPCAISPALREVA